jgi:hypothetical protein
MGPNRRTKGLRSMGRHAHMMPALASMTDQLVAGIGPQVGSGSLADAAIVVARNMDAKVTLLLLVVCHASSFVYVQCTGTKN